MKDDTISIYKEYMPEREGMMCCRRIRFKEKGDPAYLKCNLLVSAMLSLCADRFISFPSLSFVFGFLFSTSRFGVSTILTFTCYFVS